MINFNGIDVPDFVKVCNINIQTLPTVETNLKSIVGSSGRLCGQTDLGEKIISCDIKVIIPEGSSLQKCGRELAVWLRGNNFKLSPLIINDDPEVKYMAKVSNNAELSDALYLGEGSITFVVPSGDSESVEKKQFSGTGRISVNNTGSKEVYPTIKLTVGTAIDSGTILIQNTTTGDSISLFGTFKSGDVILLDCDKHLVKKNNKIDFSILNLQSEFFHLEIGQNILNCTNEATGFVVTFNDKYI